MLLQIGKMGMARNSQTYRVRGRGADVAEAWPGVDGSLELSRPADSGHDFVLPQQGHRVDLFNVVDEIVI